MMSQRISTAVVAPGRDIDPIDRAIERGIGVHVTAGFLDFLVDPAWAAGGGAFEEHVFQDMREAGAEPASFVDAAGAAPGLSGDDGRAVVFADDDGETVVQGDQRHIVRDGRQLEREFRQRG
jgi:hypothetical protein